MTIQVQNYAASKVTLQTALRNNPELVQFYDPFIINNQSFTGDDIKPDEQFAVVMDHPQRDRFAMVKRNRAGLFTVT